MSRTRIRRHETVVTPLTLGDGDSLRVGQGGALQVGGGQSAVMLAGGTSNIHNYGVIRSDDGVAVNGHLFGPVALLIRNDGSIAGGSFGITFSSDEGTTGNVIVHNLGSISAEGYAAIDFTYLHVDRIVLINHGDLNVSSPGSPSAPLAFAGSDSRDVLLNYGSIHGLISLGGGSDVFRDTGPSGGAPLTILGGDGDDRISGGDGADLIFGGAGLDVMRGGAGADLFAYSDLSDSGPDGDHADRIRGFDALEGDVIDLSRIDADEIRPEDQAFALIGTDSFSGKAGELRYDLRDGGAVVYADVNGDAVPDFTLVVRGDIHAPEDLQFLL